MGGGPREGANLISPGSTTPTLGGDAGTLRIEGLELSSMEFAKGGKESDAKIPFPSEPLSFFFNLCQTVMLLSGLS